MWKIILIIIFITGICDAGDGTYQKAGNSCAGFLKLDVGARAAGMGGAYSAVADGVEGMCWNPAGLCQIKGKGISLVHHKWIEDMNHGFVGYAQIVGEKKTVGVGVVGMFVDSLERRSGAVIKPDGSFKASDIALIIDYSQEMKQGLLGGINIKIIRQEIDQETGEGIGIDSGIIYTCPNSKVKLSAVMQNLGPKMKIYKERFPLPLTFRIGTTYQTPDQRLITAIDISKPMDNYATLHLGGEYKVIEAVGLRCGYRYKLNSPEHEFLSGLSCGIGIGVGKLQFDYGYGEYPGFGDTHQMEMSMRF